MTLLAGLDLATTAGIAIIREDHLVFSGNRRFSEKPGDDDGAVCRRAREWVREILHRFDIVEIAIEEALNTNLSKTQIVQGRNGPVKVSKPIGTDRTYKRLLGLRGSVLSEFDDEIIRRRRAGQSFKWREANNRVWRSGVYGKCSPPKTVSDTSRWWKQKALAQCKLFRWDITQTDAAEAAMIAEWLRITRKQERLGFMAKDDAPDLFGPKKKMETPF